MNLRTWLKSALDRMFRREDVAEEMEEELRAHIALRADDLEHSGMSRADSRAPRAHRVRRPRAHHAKRVRGAGRKLRGTLLGTIPVRPARAAQVAGILRGGHGDAGVGHRRQRGGVRGDECFRDPAAERGARLGASTRCSMETAREVRNRIRITWICATAATRLTACWPITSCRPGWTAGRIRPVCG